MVHGAFESNAINIENSTNITLSGNMARCPQCGGRARIADGTFNFRAGLQEIVDAPGWSREAIRTVQRAAQEANESLRRNPHGAEAAIQEFARQANAANPGVGNQILKWFLGLSAQDQMGALTLLMTTLGVAWTIFGGMSTSGEQDRINETQMQQQEQSHQREILQNEHMQKQDEYIRDLEQSNDDLEKRLTDLENEDPEE